MKSSTLGATTSLMTAALLLIGASSPYEARAQLTHGGLQTTVNDPVLVKLPQTTPIIVDRGTLGLPTAPTDDPGPDQGIPNDDMRHWAMTVPVIFSSGSWAQVEKALVVACDGPSDRGYSGRQLSSVLQVLDRDGKVIRQRRIANPRIVLPEEPREKWRLVDRAELNLTVGLAEGAAAVAFYEDTRQKEPSLVVDLTRQIAEAAMVNDKIVPACRANNPPAVPVGDGGRFVLSYALQHAAKSSGISNDRLVGMMAEYGDDFGAVAKKQKLLRPTVIDLLDGATVQR